MHISVGLLNVVTVAFIVTTMVAAGLASRLSAITRLARDLPMVALAGAANLVLIPMLGWGLGAAFGLGAAAAAALILVAASPGGPLGTRFALLQRGDVEAGATVQLALAVVGSLTFAPTAGLLLRLADTGEPVKLNVPALVATVALLQVLPFALGVGVRRARDAAALRLLPVLEPVSSVLFVALIAGLLAASWPEVAAVLTSRGIVVAVGFVIACFAIGAAMATGGRRRRTTLASVAGIRNMGPALAAAALGFHNDLAVLGPLVTVILVSVLLGLVAAALLARGRAPLAPEP